MAKNEPILNLKIEFAEVPSSQESNDIDALSETSESNLECLLCEFVGDDIHDFRNHKKENHLDKLFPCKYCDKKFPKQLSNLKRHLYNVHGKGSANISDDDNVIQLSEQCLACDYSASTKRFLSKHRKEHDNVKCKTCDKDFRKSWKSLELHYNKEHLQKQVSSENIMVQPEIDDPNASKKGNGEKIVYNFPMECYSCDEVSNNKTELRTHNKEHEIYSCKKCEYKGKLWANLRRHYQAIHEVKNELIDDSQKSAVGGGGTSFYDIEFPMECFSCNTVVRDKQHLKQHNKSHETYPCKYCDYKSTLWANLKRHFDNVHCVPKSRPDADSSTVMECFCCDTTFANAKEKRMHIKIHIDFICKTCQFVGKSWDDLGKHFMKIHLYMDNIYYFPMECYACDQVVHSKGELRIHNKQHEIFQCKVCQHKFTLFSNLRKHYETFHVSKDKFNDSVGSGENEEGMMALGCFMCDYQIKNKLDQKLHNRKHLEYICKICGYSAKKLVCNLQRHFLSKHPEAVLPAYQQEGELIMFVEGLNDYYENEEFVDEEAIDELEEEAETPKFHSTMIKQQVMQDNEEDEERFNEIIEYSLPTSKADRSGHNLKISVKKYVESTDHDSYGIAQVDTVQAKQEPIAEEYEYEGVESEDFEEEMDYEEESPPPPPPKRKKTVAVEALKRKSNSRKYECLSCHFAIEGNYDIFKQHVQDMHLGINICKICALHYHDDWYELREHCMAKHKSRIKVWMDEEDENYDDEDRPAESTDEMHECLECEFKTKNPEILAKHYRSLHNQQHVCKICGANFKNLLGNLKRHHLSQHTSKTLMKKEKKIQPVFKFSLIDNPVGNFECLVCHEENFDSCKDWNMHLWTHKSGYNCKVCHAVMKSPMNLKRHIIVKHPTKSFAMDIVGWIENPTECDTNFDCMIKNCSMSFMTHDDWIQHTRRGHKDELSCKFCGKISANVYSFQYHLDTVHSRWNRLVKEESSDKTFSCNVCKKVFRSAINLAIHSKTHKKGVTPNSMHTIT